MINKNERIGMVEKNKFGSLMQIIKYNSSSDIVVKFLEHGNQVHTSWQSFREGRVKNVFNRSVCKVGYLGEGKYKPKINGKYSPQYIVWKGMIQRCYDKNTHENFNMKYNTYENCKVAEEWHNFQIFGSWFDENYYKLGNEKIHLDKDILVKGNKIYSPDTCVFVPNNINSLFVKHHKGDCPMGVTFSKKDQIYIAQSHNGKGKIVYLGSFKNEYAAFNSYKNFKEKLIKQTAEEYKGKIPIKLFNAMMLYTVEIDD